MLHLVLFTFTQTACLLAYFPVSSALAAGLCAAVVLQSVVQAILGGFNQRLLTAAQKQQLHEEQLHLAAAEQADLNAETLSVIEEFPIKRTEDNFRERCSPGSRCFCCFL